MRVPARLLRRALAPAGLGALAAVALGLYGGAMRAPSVVPEEASATSIAPGRMFSTSFESVADFDGFYIVPQDHMGTASHDLSSERVHSGTYAHKGWIYGVNPPSTPFVNNNHRAYPTVQLHKTPGGGYACPCFVEFYAWLDMPLDEPGEWFSFATLARSTSDSYWNAVTVNVSAPNPAPGTTAGGVLHLMHVPSAGLREPTFQTSTIVFPMRQWVRISIYIDLDPANGEAKAWQDGQLVSAAPVTGGNGKLEQAHFGLYAHPGIGSGVVYNDDLLIIENYDDPLGACVYDLNNSGEVGFADLLIFAQAYGSASGGTGWNPGADFNGDSNVNFSDLLAFAVHYGWSTTACP